EELRDRPNGYDVGRSRQQPLDLGAEALVRARFGHDADHRDPLVSEQLHEPHLPVVDAARVLADADPAAVHVPIRIRILLPLLDEAFELTERLFVPLELEATGVDEGDGDAGLGVFADLLRHWAAVPGRRQVALEDGVDEGALADAAPAGDQHGGVTALLHRLLDALANHRAERCVDHSTSILGLV